MKSQADAESGNLGQRCLQSPIHLPPAPPEMLSEAEPPGWGAEGVAERTPLHPPVPPSSKPCWMLEEVPTSQTTVFTVSGRVCGWPGAPSEQEGVQAGDGSCAGSSHTAASWGSVLGRGLGGSGISSPLLRESVKIANEVEHNGMQHHRCCPCSPPPFPPSSSSHRQGPSLSPSSRYRHPAQCQRSGTKVSLHQALSNICAADTQILPLCFACYLVQENRGWVEVVLSSQSSLTSLFEVSGHWLEPDCQHPRTATESI